MEHHRPVAAAREAEGDPLLRLAVVAVMGRGGWASLNGGGGSLEIRLMQQLGHCTENSTHNG